MIKLKTIILYVQGNLCMPFPQQISRLDPKKNHLFLLPFFIEIGVRERIFIVFARKRV
jgi:hypothetical protein